MKSARDGAASSPMRSMSRLFHLVFFLSGIAGLGYQMVWARMFAVGLGHEMPSVLAMLTAFFGGFALGAWVFDRPVSRSSRPAMWYAGLELAIGVWGFVSIALIPTCNGLALKLIGVDPSPLRQWFVSFAVPLLALLPATMAMGATLPAMERAVSMLHGHARCVGGLYAVNTAGAVAGVVLSTFVLVPTWGFRASIMVLAMVNVACAVITTVLARRIAAKAFEAPSAKTPTISRLRLDITVFVTGLLGIGYEALGVRVLSQATQNTVYSFAGALTCYLLGTAIGAAIYQRWLSHRVMDHFNAILGGLMLVLCIACLLGILVLRSLLEIDHAIAAMLPESLTGSVMREMLIAAAVFGLPTILMGATFSHLVQAARKREGGVGAAMAINTLGGALAAIIFGVMILPALGAKWSLTILALAYLALIPKFTTRIAMGLTVPLFLLMVLPGDLRIVSVPEGGQLVEYHDGVMASVAVIDDAQGGRYLKVNNRFQMGATVGTFAERRLGEIPLLLHPRPRRALFLGLGTGVSFGTAVNHPDLIADGVELIPEVVQVMDRFEPVNNSPQTHALLNVYVADARRFVQASDEQYDVIIGDLFHPARDGAGALYTKEHFSAVRARLAPGGLFCQWLPTYQLDEDMLRVIVRTFLEVFPETRACIGHFNVGTPMMGLVGSLEPMQYPPDYFQKRVTDPKLLSQLDELALTDSYRLLGCLLADADELRGYCGEGPINTDDRPIVIFGAPRFAYIEHAATTWGRVLPFIDQVTKGIDELVPFDGTDDRVDGFQRALYDFIAARNVYMKGMIAAAQGRQDEALAACIQSARMSTQFSTGYAQALAAANELARSDPQKAREILKQLMEARPESPEARDVLRMLFGERAD